MIGVMTPGLIVNDDSFDKFKKRQRTYITCLLYMYFYV